MIKNNYLDIAKNDLEYLESILAVGSTFYNQLAVPVSYTHLTLPTTERV